MVTITPSVPLLEPPPAMPTMAVPNVPQVPPLTDSQIAQFKRDGFLVLPGVLDPDLCRRARDDMWEAIGEYLPRMKRDDPSTWTPITDEEAAGFPAVPPRRPAVLRRRRNPVLRAQRHQGFHA